MTKYLNGKAGYKRWKMGLTFRNLSSAPLVSNVSFPFSSTVKAASFARVRPIAKGCPGLLNKKTLFKSGK